MATATYTLLKMAAGRCHYAEVTVSAEAATECSVVVSAESFTWLREVYGPNAVCGVASFDPERRAAEAGAWAALRQIPGRDEPVRARVVIERIHFLDVDTTPADIELATRRAVWQALGVSVAGES